MPTFCRHNRLIQNCPICTREQEIEARPLVSSSAPRSSERAPSSGSSTKPRPPRARSAGGRAASVRVRRPPTAVDDGYRSSLLPGLRSTLEAQRLVEELAFATARLDRLRHDPPGLYAEVADHSGEVEERTWLAFLIAYLGPVEDRDDPFEAIQAVRTPWGPGQIPELEGTPTGPRTAHDPSRGQATLTAYRGWTERAGSQAAGFTGEPAWAADRRFARIFERLSLPGLNRGARFELLVSLGVLGVYELQAGALALGGSDEVTVAAKRAFGIGDPLLLERRAAQLAEACAIPLQALDLALYNWGRGQRAAVGVPVESHTEALNAVAHALGVEAASDLD